MSQHLRVKIDEKLQKEIFTKLIIKLDRDFTKTAKFLEITNSNLSKYKRAVTRFVPERVLLKATEHLKIEMPPILEKGTLSQIRSNYMKKAYPVLREKYSINCFKELTKRRDFKGISLQDFPDYIFIYLEDNYRKKFLQNACNLAGSQDKLARIIRISTSRFTNWYAGKQKDYKTNKVGIQFIPLRKIKIISNLLVEDNNYAFSMENIQRNVAMYRMRAGNPITNPIFPIKESPEMIRLLFHLLGDGYSGNKKDSANYKNIRQELLDEFKNDLNIFGNVPIYEQQYSIKFPRVIAEVIENFYDVNTMTFDSRITSNIKRIPKKWLYFGIRAFVDDEGCMTKSSIVLYSANSNLLEGIKQILDYLKIKRGEIRTKLSEKATYGKMFTIEIKDLGLYYKKIGFTHLKKKEKLEFYLKKKKRKRRSRLLKLKT